MRSNGHEGQPLATRTDSSTVDEHKTRARPRTPPRREIATRPVAVRASDTDRQPLRSRDVISFVDEVSFDVVPASSASARWAMQQYFDELAARFKNGFDDTGALDEAATDFDPPSGLFVLVRRGGEAIGCGAVQFIDIATAEIKRMWISSAVRGQGLGKRLLTHLEFQARQANRTRTVLDTNEVLTQAIAMYRSLGYTAIERYNDNPYAHHWFEKQLSVEPTQQTDTSLVTE